MLQRLGFPRVGEHRRFVSAIVADTIGSGLFMPLTILYFLKVTDLTLVQVGAALSVSALLTMPAAFVIGTLVDRFGGRRMMLVGNLVQGAGMLAYLWVEAFWPVALATVLLNLGRQAFWGSFGNVVTAITQRGEREPVVRLPPGAAQPWLRRRRRPRRHRRPGSTPGSPSGPSSSPTRRRSSSPSSCSSTCPTTGPCSPTTRRSAGGEWSCATVPTCGSCSGRRPSLSG